MAEIPSGTLTTVVSESEGGDVIGTRRAYAADDADLLATCPLTVFVANETAPKTAWPLSSGFWATQGRDAINGYGASGNRLWYLDGTTPPDGIIVGSDGVETYYVAFLTVEDDGAKTLQAGLLDAETGVLSGVVEVDTLPAGSLAQNLYAVAADRDGLLYYVKGDDADPSLANNDLITYDVPGDTTGSTILTYAQGVAFPLQVGFPFSSFVFGDGSLLFLFNTYPFSLSNYAVKHLAAANGAVLQTYAVSSTTLARVFAGADDTTFWIVDGADRDYREVATADGAAVHTFTTIVDGAPSVTTYAYEGCTPPPTPGTASPLRRTRVFPLLFDRNLTIFLSRLEIFLQAGVGLTTGQGSDPQLMIRLSTDGGKTFGSERWVSAGEIGEYFHRSYLLMLGSGRNWVCELNVSDPVIWQFLEAFTDHEVGTS